MVRSVSIRAKLNFLVPRKEYKHKRPIYFASEGGAEANLQMTGKFELTEVELRDARQLPVAPTLDREGFALIKHSTKVGNFFSDFEIDNIYKDEVRELISNTTGAARVVVFDHTRRSDSKDIRTKHKVREPAKVIHNDYSPCSAYQRVRDLLPDEEKELLKKRFAIVNAWRPIRNPVEATPLALCDARSLESINLITAERRARDRVGELMLVTHSESQRWMYFPNLTTTEILLIKTWDTAEDGRARYSAHGAFDDPTSPLIPSPRESIETRAFAFFN